jgi:uncharacterized sulfatase
MKRFLTLFVIWIACGVRALERPNVVFIISDDHAWTDYGFMGHPVIETPRLDVLAAESALFRRGYVPTALCRPALATLANGLYAHQHRITGNDPAGGGKGNMAEYRAKREQLIAQYDRHPSLPKWLGEAGYWSHQSGKWWEGSWRRGGFTHGMTRGFPEPGGRHGDDGLKIGREGLRPIVEFLDAATAEKKPFFLWYAPFLPHTPHNPPPRLFTKYKAKGVASDHVARYYAMVEWFDETCGELLGELDRRGLREDTLVVYLADNGWIQRPDAPSFAARSKQSAHEGGIRQPILFRWPKAIRAGDRGEQLCSSIDIVPTVLAAAGLPVPAHLPGLNLLPQLRSGDPSPRDTVLGETFAHDIADIERPAESLVYRWVIEGRWKLLLTYDGQVGRHAEVHGREDKRPQLYDLIADPHETRNCAAEEPERVARLAEKLRNWWPAEGRRVQETWTGDGKDQP